MKKIKIGYWIGAVVALCVMIFCLIYTRPRTVAQRYAYLDFSQCTKIEGAYSVYPTVDHKPFVITPDDARFNEILDIIQSAAIKTKITNIFPHGTRVHRNAEGDNQWELEFCFDSLSLPDGSTASGSILSFQDFFGDMTCTVNGEILFCTVKDDEQWTQRIMDLIVHQ